jgi:alpha-amylase
MATVYFADAMLCQYLMVDIVTNHMAYMGCRSCVDYSRFNPFSSA